MNRMTLKVSSPDSTAAAEAFYERTFQITFSIWLAFSIASVSFLFSPAANIVFKVVKVFLVALGMRTKSWTEEVRDWGSACTAGRTSSWPWRGSPRA